MKSEYASHKRTGVIAPTAAEFELAEKKGIVLTGDVLRQFRAEARATRTVSSKLGAGTPTDNAKITQLNQMINRLQNENTLLKVQLMQQN